jgi:hypothetical protein
MRPVALTLPPKSLPAPVLTLVFLVSACSAADNGYKGIVPGTALGKLCHELNRGGNPVTLTLQFGNTGDPGMVSITGVTGVCAPAAGMPCTTIPVGKVPIKLFEGDRLLVSRDVILNPPAACAAPNEFVFQPFVSSTLQVGVTGGRIAPGTCQGLDFPPPDAGVTDGGGDGAVLEAGAGVEAGPPADAGAPEAPVVMDAAADTAEDAAADAAADLAAD